VDFELKFRKSGWALCALFGARLGGGLRADACTRHDPSLSDTTLWRDVFKPGDCTKIR
jgi:hypothetical protein